jgi:hypothetical protein
MLDTKHPVGTPEASASVSGVEETWRTRPERVGQFVGNLLFCLIFPIVAIWYVPKYVMRQEYVKAVAALAVSLVWPIVYLTMPPTGRLMFS